MLSTVINFFHSNNRKSNLRLLFIILVSATLPLKLIIVNNVFVVLLVLHCLYSFLIKKIQPRFYLMIFLLFNSFFFLTVFSAVYSANAIPLISKIETRATIFGLSFILLIWPEIDKKAFDRTLYVFLLSTITISLLCLIYTFSQNYLNGLTYSVENNWFFSSDNLVDRFGFHPNYFSVYSSFSIFIALYFYKNKKFTLGITIAIIFYLSIFIFLLASRVGILSFIALLGITIIRESYLRKRIFLGILSILIIIGLAFLIGYSSQIVRFKFEALLNQNIHEYNEPFRVNRRLIQWESATQIFIRNPLLGVGEGDMQDELQKIYLQKGFLDGFSNKFNPHNIFLDAAASLGLVGLVSIMSLFFISFRICLTNKNVLHFQFLFLFLAISLVESSFSVQKGVTFFFFFNAIFISHLINQNNSDEKK